jgi:C-terminal processing protease CtpA/Prc
MNKGVVAIAIGLLASLAAAAIVLTVRKPAPADVFTGSASEYFDQSAAIDDRIRALEAAVAEERNARQLLEDELQILYAEIGRVSEQQDASTARDEQQVADARELEQQQREILQQRSARIRESRLDRLVESGISPERAEWILKRESELQMEVMQARFDARRSGEPFDPFDSRMNPNAVLRSEIGDTAYEQYLQANGRQTTISVSSVLESSPGQRAGLQPGDQIVSYGGARVFDVSDLNRQTMLGEPGESVVVDIMRDGVPMQIVMPRGPVGVSTSRFPGRR